MGGRLACREGTLGELLEPDLRSSGERFEVNF